MCDIIGNFQKRLFEPKARRGRHLSDIFSTIEKKTDKEKTNFL